MNNESLYKIVRDLMTEGKGILAADESDSTVGKRLAIAKLPNEPEHRRVFRELMFTTPDLESVISGVILHDSTLRDETSDGLPFADILSARGIVPGIKVDAGTVPLNGFDGDLITEGLDGLGDRLKKYHKLGARFAKWRAVFTVSPESSDVAIEANTVMLARYAQIAQAAGIVPIVESEVLYDGDHSLEAVARVTQHVLQILMVALPRYKVDLKAVILKTSMVLAGKEQLLSKPDEVADATLRTLHLSVPHTLGGVVFLSGGQTPRQATENLNAICAKGKQPWNISSSFSRALEEPFLETWRGKPENTELAQAALLHRARMNGDAQKGVYIHENDKVT